MNATSLSAAFEELVFQGTSWSHLAGRKWDTKIDEVWAKYGFIIYGVPQGAILEPLSKLQYLNGC